MKIIIPENLNEITIKQYFDFKKVADLTQDENTLRLSLITIFCKLSINDVRNNLTTQEFNDISNHLNEVLQQEPQFINKFTVNGVDFGFIPNLDEITAGEYIDLDSYTSNEDSYLESMAVMYRPIVGKFSNLYNIEAYESAEKYKDIMNEAPLNAYLGAMVFFYNLSNELLIATQSYFNQETEEMKVLEAVLMRNGVGIHQFIQSLEEISLNVKMLQERMFTSSSLF